MRYALLFPQSSVRDTNKTCGCTKSHTWNVLNVHGEHSYQPRLVQELLPGDEDRRISFWSFIMNKLEKDPTFVNDILWTDNFHELVLWICLIHISSVNKTTCHTIQQTSSAMVRECSVRHLDGNVKTLLCWWQLKNMWICYANRYLTS